MHRSQAQLWLYTVPLLSLGMVLTSCGDTGTGGPGNAVPVSVESATSTSPAPGSTITSPPTETCAAFLLSAPCSTYTGISGTANNQDLSWVASEGIKAQLTTVNGALWLAVTTRCAPISGPATITATTLTVRDIAIGASGCTDSAGDQQQWVLDFLKRPIEQTFSNETLTWKSGTDTLNFKGE
nr:hypothetical protein GCM10017547_20220 [Pseudarthrobacter oxydans]